MPSDTLKGMNTRQAVEEIAHEIRSRQLSILSMAELLRRMDSGELDADSRNTIENVSEGLDSIQLCVQEISGLLDTLVEFVREEDAL